jgi:hypothetical protein
VACDISCQHHHDNIELLSKAQPRWTDFTTHSRNTTYDQTLINTSLASTFGSFLFHSQHFEHSSTYLSSTTNHNSHPRCHTTTRTSSCVPQAHGTFTLPQLFKLQLQADRCLDPYANLAAEAVTPRKTQTYHSTQTTPPLKQSSRLQPRRRLEVQLTCSQYHP